MEELADAAECPVINGLTDLHHPCQALADVQALRERLGSLEGRSLAWLGDGYNNVCHSLIAAAGMLGMDVTVASPAGYEPDADVLAAAGATLTDGPAGGGGRASMPWSPTSGRAWARRREREQRLADLRAYQVNAALLEHAAADHVVLHCLPAHYGEEITKDVLHGPHSAAWDEAENRLHAQKALLAMLVA